MLLGLGVLVGVLRANQKKKKKNKEKEKEKIKHPRKCIKIGKAESATNKRKWRT